MFLFDSIQKPTLLLDREKTIRNIHRMTDKARRQGVRFRPHFKTHQSAEIGEWLRTAGVQAITVSSLDMAEYFANHGWDDITIAFPANLRQIDGLRALAERVHLGILIELVDAAEFLDERFPGRLDVWIKVDAGSGRTGLSWDRAEQVVGLTRQITGSRRLQLRGLLAHAGHTYQAHGAEEVCRLFTENVTRMNALRSTLARDGLEGIEVSVGDTPGCSLCEDWGGVDEVRPGNFVFYDAHQLEIGSCRAEDIAVALACPVVALHPEREEAVIYGGAIHLSKDSNTIEGHTAYGLVALPEGKRWGAPLLGAYVRGLSQEHGILHVPSERLSGLRVGDLVCILPSHSCLTVTAMQDYVTLDGQIIHTMNSCLSEVE